MDTSQILDKISEEFPQQSNRQKRYQKEPDKARRANNREYCKSRRKALRKSLKDPFIGR